MVAEPRTSRARRPARPPVPRRGRTSPVRGARARPAACHRAERGPPARQEHPRTTRAERGRWLPPTPEAPSPLSGRRSRARASTNAGPSPSAARSSVPTFPGSATRQRASPTGSVRAARQVGAAEHGDDARRMRQRREARHHLGCDELRPGEALDQRRPLGVDQRLHGLEAGVETGLDEILALADEEAELLALPARLELPDELDPRVGRGRDHAERLGGFDGTLLVAGARWSFRGKDAGSVRIEEIRARLRTQSSGRAARPGGTGCVSSSLLRPRARPSPARRSS